jgi:peptidoglycan/LPS O-acetylase OafA/YrhL
MRAEEKQITLSYQPRLDGVRAVAVLLVIENHFVTVGGNFTFGLFGVRLFFVLSGYLISRIIFNYRSSPAPVWKLFSVFYWRRAIRLYPPLIVVIAATIAFDLASMREDWPWHLFYLSNFKMFLDQSYGAAAPLWSLSVEEQFYLIWFPLLLLLPLRRITLAIITSIAIGSFFKLIISPFLWVAVLLPTNIDYLALGALMAYLENYQPESDERITKTASNIMLVSALLIVILIARFNESFVWSQIDDFVNGILAFCIVSSARKKTGSLYFEFLEWRPLLHIGRISYGLYIYHYFVAEYLHQYGVLSALKNSWGGRPAMLAVELALTLLVAETSWVLIERPLSKLKDTHSRESLTIVSQRAD